ncbi:MAG: mechanosensitive ion channel domain-containing protein [Acidobacteriota bacterium]
MKKILLTLFIITLTTLMIQAQEDPLKKITGFETSLTDLKAKILTLEEFSPGNFPGFQDLEKTNQLVELLDFNKRKFKLLLEKFNLITDKIFPFLTDYSKSEPGKINLILSKLNKFSGSGDNSLLKVQRDLNHVLLKISRIEKEIEMVQMNKRSKEMAKDLDKRSMGYDSSLPIGQRISLLSDEKKSLEKELNEQKEKLKELENKEAEKSKKIDEKNKEISKLRKKSRSGLNNVEKLSSLILSRAVKLRVNGLEIPQLNTTRTLIYLTKTKTGTLEQKISNLDRDINLLEERKTKEMTSKLIKGVIVIIAAIMFVLFLIRISRMISSKTLKRIEKSESIDPHRKQRYQTLSSVILSFIKIVLWISATVWVLGVLNIDYGPFLVAAGGISLAIGFGAQSLVKDIVTGFFLLMEEQFALGDVVEINGKSGTIEKISLRTIKFRSLDGTLHIIPNGEISIVSNSTYQWSRAVINIGVSYDVDSSKVMQVLQSLCSSIHSDPVWKDKLLGEPVPQGIISFGDSSVNYRVLAKTKTGEQWGVAREFNIRLQKAFNESNIDIPYNYINIVNVNK